MVGTIQPEWVCGPIPPRDGRHGQAIETIVGIYAVHVLDQQFTPKKWHESFRKIWHRGGHQRDFNKTYRGARPNDHDYYKEHYEPGRKALAHHLKAIADTHAWQKRKEQKDNVDKIFKKIEDIEKQRKSFQNLARHKQEQKDLWTKAERSVMKLVQMTTIHDEPPRARDMPQFDPKPIGKRGHLIPIGINKDPNIFHPEYTNLYKLDRYLKNLDSKKRELLKHLRGRPGRVPYQELRNIVTQTVNHENVVAMLEVKQLLDFERILEDAVAKRRAEEALQPPPWVPGPDDWWGSGNVPSIEEPTLKTDDYQKYAL